MTSLPSLPPLDVQATLRGKRILFTGSTGFLGKVTLSMLMHRYGEEIDRVYALVRRGTSASAERRFFDLVAASEPFGALRESLGEERAQELTRRKCKVLDGDVTLPRFGLSEEQVKEMEGEVDVVVNCAGLVSFNPSLESSLNINTHSVRHAANLCLALDVPLVHVSTAFVVGNRDGLFFEDEEVLGYFPKKDVLDGRDFSLEEELSDCERVVARLRERADDKALTSLFRKRALERLAEEGRDAENERTLRLAVARERKLWLSGELTKAGMERAEHWGWPNTYTYTKALGEQVLASTPLLRYAIVRPSIVESAVAFPFPGWNEGFTTSAPLVWTVLQAPFDIPAGEKTILDVIPVDHVAAALVAITAHSLTVRERRVYQVASGDSNPFLAQRSIELVGLFRRRHFRAKTTGNRQWNDLLSRIEPLSVSKAAFEARSAPLFLKGARKLLEVLEDVKPTWGAPNVSAMVERTAAKLEEVEDRAASVQGLVDLFLPFIWSHRRVFHCDNTRAVFARMVPADRERLHWGPETIDWREYFLDIHLPGLEKWVFPELEAETKKKSAIAAYRDLVELLEASVHAHRHRVAFRYFGEDDRETRFTFGEVHRYAMRVASFLARGGVGAGDRIALVSENRPEWGMAYFGILRAGATAVPIDPELSQAEVVNVVRRANAKVCLISEQAATDHPELFRAMAGAGLVTKVFSLAQAMEGDDTQPDRIADLPRTTSPDDLASIIFTSGTTGQPKGVMLTHRNFASLVAKLAGAFEVGVGDGLLSVLPLHHTFEFACGFLLPFSRGAEVAYIDELTSDRIGDVFETGRVTAMIGVPALWQLLHRKITQELAAKPRWVELATKALMSAHSELRNRTAFNLGKVLFWPVHRKFGGRMKFLVSGGSALQEDVAQAFHALGFDMSEGYGLTEAAPVLAVGEVTNALHAGSVGKALPGIELRIGEPDADGVGEVLARGPNVMAGYFEDPEATDAAIVDGWLHTGDLGRLDSAGRLVLVGRKKDLILDASGKNVYPDELEELYGAHDRIKELCIVGLPDEAGGERVACLCVPDYGDRAPAEVRREIEEHFRRISADLQFHRRVKVLHLWDGELAKTSTRKVKRKPVALKIQDLERRAAAGAEVKRAGAAATMGEGVHGWLIPLVADVLHRPDAEVRPDSRLAADLGFDSLTLTELAVALEQAGVSLEAAADLTRIETVDDLRKLIEASGKKAIETKKEPRRGDAGEDAEESAEIEIPELVAEWGSSLLDRAQELLYSRVFDVKIVGRSYIPQNRNFLVISNHTSHLDMGLIKVVLREQGKRLAALAARDYFFDTPAKRAYFENFTNLIPMDRQGGLRESLRLAGEVLDSGWNLLVFPEGTRSTSGEMAEFKPTLGYLALTNRVDVLPLHIHGAFEAMPKGAFLPKPKARDLVVRIGPPLLASDLERATAGLGRSDAHRWATKLAEEAVKALRDGRPFKIEPPPPPATAKELPADARKASKGRSEP